MPHISRDRFPASSPHSARTGRSVQSGRIFPRLFHHLLVKISVFVVARGGSLKESRPSAIVCIDLHAPPRRSRCGEPVLLPVMISGRLSRGLRGFQLFLQCRHRQTRPYAMNRQKGIRLEKSRTAIADKRPQVASKAEPWIFVAGERRQSSNPAAALAASPETVASQRSIDRHEWC